MNLSEALDAALPEIPKTLLSRTRPPRLDPELVTREDVLELLCEYFMDGDCERDGWTGWKNRDAYERSAGG